VELLQTYRYIKLIHKNIIILIKLVSKLISNIFQINFKLNSSEYIGDWGLGIGDWANPQSPIPNPQVKLTD